MIGRFLGIDHGLARIGVAVSDPLGITARELTIIDVTDDDPTFHEIKEIARQQNVIGVIVGLPSNVGGSSEQADAVLAWVDELKKIIDLPVKTWDEQLSSSEAKELARLQKRSPKDKIDDLAARVILQSYLNALADGLAERP